MNILKKKNLFSAVLALGVCAIHLSNEAMAQYPKGDVLNVEAIEFLSPSAAKETGYHAKVTFMPQGEKYDGRKIGTDTVQYFRQTRKFFVRSQPINGEPLDINGLFFPQLDGFTYSVLYPKAGNLFTVLDDDGALIATLFGDIKIDPQTDETLKNYGSSLSGDVEDGFYYEQVSEQTKEAVRINSKNHAYSVSAELKQKLQGYVKDWCMLRVGNGFIKAPVPGGTPFSVTLSDALRATTPHVFPDDTQQKLSLNFNGDDFLSGKIHVTATYPNNRRTTVDCFPVKTDFQCAFVGNVTTDDEGYQKGDFVGWDLVLTTAKGQDIGKFGPVYYPNQNRLGGSVPCSWALHAINAAKQELTRQADQALQSLLPQLFTYLDQN